MDKGDHIGVFARCTRYGALNFPTFRRSPQIEAWIQVLSLKWKGDDKKEVDMILKQIRKFTKVGDVAYLAVLAKEPDYPGVSKEDYALVSDLLAVSPVDVISAADVVIGG